jgi:hypothetical protein
VTQEKSPAANGANPTTTFPNSTVYPPRITLSEAAETYIDRLGVNLMLGRVEVHQLPPSLRQLWWFGWHSAWEQQQCEIRRLNHQLDRLYVAAFNPADIDPNRPTYAELERRRGNHEHADHIEADMAILFEQVSA